MTENTENKDQSPLIRIIVGRNYRHTLIRAAVLAVVAFIFFKTILLPVRVNGTSMVPTYASGSFTFINNLSYTFSRPERGDIVAIKTTGKSVMYLKRIVALPGETVAFKDGVLFVNNSPVEEPYLRPGSTWNMEPEPVGENDYFAVGDNRSMEIGNHLFGAVNKKKIVGRPLF